jgi:hypothetical protein
MTAKEIKRFTRTAKAMYEAVHPYSNYFASRRQGYFLEMAKAAAPKHQPSVNIYVR